MGAVERMPSYGSVATAWAGAAIGEAILRLGGRVSGRHVSTAVLQSCTTFVAARAFGLWGSDGMRQAIARYEHARELLGSPPAGVSKRGYEEVWSVLETLSGGAFESSQSLPLSLASELAMVCCRDIQGDGFIGSDKLNAAISALGWPGEFTKYETSTAEQRLEMFDQALVYSERQDRIAKYEVSVLADFIIAYFADKISGSGSAHIHLIEGLLSRRPMVMLWYGIVSSLYRPGVWGAEFGGLARLAMKELKVPIRLDEAPRSDVSLEELITLVEPTETHQTLGFRGASPRILNVEVSLGVAGAIRLVNGSEEHERSAVSRTSEEARLGMRRVVSSLWSVVEEAQEVADVLEEMDGRRRRAGPIGKTKSSSGTELGERQRRRGKGSTRRSGDEEDGLPFDEQR
ncbi:MAG: hypothetical protein F4103_05735 [Boseongicola sp. SB0673_bin_14]|nr:hypothetical protein [Boseongicola sp. SB0673_bin_14]